MKMKNYNISIMLVSILMFVISACDFLPMTEEQFDFNTGKVLFSVEDFEENENGESTRYPWIAEGAEVHDNGHSGKYSMFLGYSPLQGIFSLQSFIELEIDVPDGAFLSFYAMSEDSNEYSIDTFNFTAKGISKNIILNQQWEQSLIQLNPGTQTISFTMGNAYFNLDDISLIVGEVNTNSSLYSDTETSLTWDSLDFASKYTFQLAIDPEFTYLVHSSDTLKTNSIDLKGFLEPGHIYYWRYRGIDDQERVYPWSEVQIIARGGHRYKQDFSDVSIPPQHLVRYEQGAEVKISEQLNGSLQFKGDEPFYTGNFSFPVDMAFPGRLELRHKKANSDYIPKVTINYNDTVIEAVEVFLDGDAYLSIFTFPPTTGWIELQVDLNSSSDTFLIDYVDFSYDPGAVTPDNHSFINDESVNISWENPYGFNLFHLQVSKDSQFSDLLFENNSLTQTQSTVAVPVSHNIKYSWRFRGRNSETEDWSDWSSSYSFYKGATSDTFDLADLKPLQDKYSFTVNPVLEKQQFSDGSTGYYISESFGSAPIMWMKLYTDQAKKIFVQIDSDSNLDSNDMSCFSGDEVIGDKSFFTFGNYSYYTWLLPPGIHDLSFSFTSYKPSVPVLLHSTGFSSNLTLPEVDQSHLTGRDSLEWIDLNNEYTEIQIASDLFLSTLLYSGPISGNTFNLADVALEAGDYFWRLKSSATTVREETFSQPVPFTIVGPFLDEEFELTLNNTWDFEFPERVEFVYDDYWNSNSLYLRSSSMKVHFDLENPSHLQLTSMLHSQYYSTSFTVLVETEEGTIYSYKSTTKGYNFGRVYIPAGKTTLTIDTNDHLYLDNLSLVYFDDGVIIDEISRKSPVGTFSGVVKSGAGTYLSVDMINSIDSNGCLSVSRLIGADYLSFDIGVNVTDVAHMEFYVKTIDDSSGLVKVYSGNELLFSQTIDANSSWNYVSGIIPPATSEVRVSLSNAVFIDKMMISPLEDQFTYILEDDLSGEITLNSVTGDLYVGESHNTPLAGSSKTWFFAETGQSGQLKLDVSITEPKRLYWSYESTRFSGLTMTVGEDVYTFSATGTQHNSIIVHPLDKTIILDIDLAAGQSLYLDDIRLESINPGFVETFDTYGGEISNASDWTLSAEPSPSLAGPDAEGKSFAILHSNQSNSESWMEQSITVIEKSVLFFEYEIYQILFSNTFFFYIDGELQFSAAGSPYSELFRYKQVLEPGTYTFRWSFFIYSSDYIDSTAQLDNICLMPFSP